MADRDGLEIACSSCGLTMEQSRMLASPQPAPHAMPDKDAAFLTWVADRLVHVYGDSPNVDFVQKLRALAQPAAVEPQFDVRTILLDVVPDENGMAKEVYAKNTAEVVDTLTKMSELLDSLQSVRTQPAAVEPARPTDDELWDQTLRERDHAQSQLDKLTSLILGEPIEWMFHDAKWQEAIDVMEAKNVAPAALAQPDAGEKA